MLRRWSLILLVLGFIAQISVLGRTIFMSQQTLNHGKEYRFLTAPLDPYDAFRGRYVWLQFAVLSETYLTDKASCEKINADAQAIVHLAQDNNGFAQIVGVSTDYPQVGDSFVTQAWCYDPTSSYEAVIVNKGENLNPDSQYEVGIKLPFTKFYANEYQAPELEAQARDNPDTTYLSVRVLNHRAVPEALHIGK